MSEERKQVLDMLAEGKITTEEAERLLEKLGPGDGTRQRRHQRKHRHWKLGGRHDRGQDAGEAEPEELEEAVEASAGNGAAPKYLRVLVNSKDGDEVNIRVPLKLIRTGIKLSTMLPSETNAKLADKGIDLSELGRLEGEDLVQALRELTVDVDSSDGDTVRIFCE